MSLQMYLFWVFYTNGIVQYVTFCVWLLSCSMSSKLLHMYQYLVPFLLTVIYFWVCGVFIGAHGLLSSCGGQGLLSGCGGQGLLLLWSTGSRTHGLH